MRNSSQSAKHSVRRAGLSLLELGVVVVILGIIVLMLLPMSRRGGGASRRTMCKNNLKQIGLALHNYATVHDNTFPPAYTVDADGNRLHSWRTLILPYMEQRELYERIDFTLPWDHPKNKAVFETAQVTQSFICPSAADMPDHHTTYVAVVGDNAMFTGSTARSMKDITDGMSNTLTVAEVAASHSVPWMSPNDISAAELISSIAAMPTNHTGGLQMLVGDGSVRFVSAKIDKETLTAALTADAGDTVDEW